MRRQLVPALGTVLVATVLLGLAYPLAMTGVAQLLFDGRADGSLVTRDGEVVGSRWIGQPFSGPGYLHPRPSAAGDGYDGARSGGSNLGPTDDRLLATVSARAARYRAENGLPAAAPVPVDAVTASASGLDPYISVANARIQARRVARHRGLPLETVLAVIADHTDGRALGFLGEPGVNVLLVNVALDEIR